MKKVLEKKWITESGHEAVVYFQIMGFRCGYVKVDKDSKIFGMEYKYVSIPFEDIDEDFIRNIETMKAINKIEVHGGLSFNGKLSGIDGYWFGFDCGNVLDKIDRDSYLKYYGKEAEKRLYLDDSKVRTLEYCIQECEKLSNQIEEIEIKENLK